MMNFYIFVVSPIYRVSPMFSVFHYWQGETFPAKVLEGIVDGRSEFAFKSKATCDAPIASGGV